LQVVTTPPGKKRRRDLVGVYVGFDDNNNGAIATQDLGIAAIFFLDSNGHMTTDNGKQVGSQITQDSRIFKFLNTPPGFSLWSFPGGVGQLAGAGGFCLIAGTINAVVDISICVEPIYLIQQGM